jgi:O-antigen ligase
VAFVATLILVWMSILRPMEIWPALDGLHLLEIFTALAAIGVASDSALGRRRGLGSPQLPFLIGFLIVSYGASAIMLGREGVDRATARALLPSVFMLVVMYGVRSAAQLRALVALVVLSSVFVAGVAVHQGLQDPQCIELPEDEDVLVDSADGTPDGRTCATPRACYTGGRAGVEYACERVGLFSTSTVARRVRWRGQLDDPNDLAVFIGAVVPFLLVTAAASKRRVVSLLALAAIGLDLYVLILTQSRGGQLMIAAVFVAYFVGRDPKKALWGVLGALPVLLLGGRDGASADSSTDERVDLLFDGVRLMVQHPVFGLGLDGFQDELQLTAHNSYLLAAAELGLPGMFLWTGLAWASLKIPITIVRRPLERIEPAVRSMAVALIVSLLGMGVGIFFLSFTFKQLLFVWLGLSGALYGAAQASDPDLRVHIGPRDCLGVAAFDVLILAGLFVYTRLEM